MASRSTRDVQRNTHWAQTPDFAAEWSSSSNAFHHDIMVSHFDCSCYDFILSLLRTIWIMTVNSLMYMASLWLLGALIVAASSDCCYHSGTSIIAIRWKYPILFILHLFPKHSKSLLYGLPGAMTTFYPLLENLIIPTGICIMYVPMSIFPQFSMQVRCSNGRSYQVLAQFTSYHWLRYCNRCWVVHHIILIWPFHMSWAFLAFSAFQ